MWHWRNERDKWGHVKRSGEKVQVYECQFTTTKSHPKNKEEYTSNMRVLVVCDAVEDAISACRKQWPENFVLHQVCLLYTSPSPRDQRGSRMPSSA